MAGGTNIVGGLTYRLEIQDNVTPKAKQGASAQKELSKTIKGTTQTMEQQTLSFISNVMAISALEGGINALAESFTKLGIGGEKVGEQMRKLAAGVKLFTGTAQLIQGLIGVVRLLAKSEMVLAGVETYRKVLHNPAQLALVAAAAGSAGAVGGYLAGRGGDTSNVNQNITYNAPVDIGSRRSFERSGLEIVGGS